MSPNPKEVLSGLLERKVGRIKVTCLDSPACKEGCYEGALSRKDKKFELVTTGHLGRVTFGASDIIEADGNSVTVLARLESGSSIKMRLEPKS